MLETLEMDLSNKGKEDKRGLVTKVREATEMEKKLCGWLGRVEIQFPGDCFGEPCLVLT